MIRSRDGKPSVVNLTDAQWKKLAELYSKIDLKTFNDLEGPTMERAYDGKPHADMTIVVKKKCTPGRCVQRLQCVKPPAWDPHGYGKGLYPC